MSSGLKTCRECGLSGPDDLFTKGRRGKPWCTECYNAYYRRLRAAQSPEQKERRLQATREWFERNPGYRGAEGSEERQWAAHLWRQYGLTLATYAALVEQHDNRCAICGVEGTPEELLCVDHCHATGTVRGMLCRRHNLALGKFDDDPELLEKAAAYLRQRGSTPALQTPLDGANKEERSDATS